MSEQLAIDGTERSLKDLSSKPLTARQQHAFDYVRERDGVTADEVGAAWHAANGKHDAGSRCDFCARDGNSVLRSKALHPLVRYRLDARLGRVYVLRQPGRSRPAKTTGVIATSDPNPETNPFADL